MSRVQQPGGASGSNTGEHKSKAGPRENLWDGLMGSQWAVGWQSLSATRWLEEKELEGLIKSLDWKNLRLL